jgi:ribonuclease HI
MVSARHIRAALTKLLIDYEKARPKVHDSDFWLSARNGSLSAEILLQTPLKRCHALQEVVFKAMQDKYICGEGAGHKHCPLCDQPFAPRTRGGLAFNNTLHFAYECPAFDTDRKAMAADCEFWGIPANCFSLLLDFPFEVPTSGAEWSGLIASAAAIHALWKVYSGKVFGNKEIPSAAAVNVSWRGSIRSFLTQITRPMPPSRVASLPIPVGFDKLAALAKGRLASAKRGDAYSVFADGGAKPSPAQGNRNLDSRGQPMCDVATAGIVIVNLTSGGYVVLCDYLGKATNNEAEAWAAAAAYFIVSSLKGTVKSSTHDSKLIVDCLKGSAEAGSNPAVAFLIDLATELLAKCKANDTVVKAVPREENALADLAANVAYFHIPSCPIHLDQVVVLDPRAPGDLSRRLRLDYELARTGLAGGRDWKLADGNLATLRSDGSAPTRGPCDPLSPYGKPPQRLMLAATRFAIAMKSAKAFGTEKQVSTTRKLRRLLSCCGR